MFVPLSPLRCLHRAADIFGSRIGIVCGERQFTYSEFKTRCEQLATGLVKLGILPGDRVAYLSFNTHPLLEGYYGVVQARAILTPLNIRLSQPELSAILRHCGARVLIYDPEFTALVQDLKDAGSEVEHWISIGPDVRCPDCMTYEDLLGMGHPEHAEIFTYDEMAIAELFYTSGSTGAPKGVTYSHRTLYLHALDYALQYRHPETMIDLHTIPLFHANGWGRPQASTLLGTKQILVRKFDPEEIFRLVETHRATDICLVPTMANALVNHPSRAQYDLSSLRHINMGGAANSAELVERMERAFPECECSSGYGLTETSPVITHSQPKSALLAFDDASRFVRQSKTGWALPGTTLRVVKTEADMLVDVARDGQSVGEIVAMGDHVMDGYFQDQEATEASFTGPWLHTGDMAVWDHDGYINIVDRKKQIIISGGENISSIEVEAAIAAHSAVLECAVVAAPDARWGEVPAGIVVLKPNAMLTEAELIEHLRPRLAKFKLPRIVEFRTEPLPKTGTGKIKKQELREAYWVGQTARVNG
ncbi:MAG: long-chain-fatty-acid--CoA ligase [Acidobacteriota bacterium]